MRKQLLVVGTVLIVGACADGNVPSGPSRLAPLLQGGDMNTQLVADEYLVVLRDDISDVAGASQVSGAAVLSQWGTALKGYAVRANAEQVRAIREDPRVRFVEPNGRVSIVATQSPVPSWGLDRIDQVSLPLSGGYTYANNGAGVHAYIIDTGIRETHTEFTGRIGNHFDAVTAGGTANDGNGHGTHVAGTVGGTLHGVAKGVTLHAVRVLDASGSGTWAQVISGINWVAANRIQPAVANMSIGGGLNSAVNTATTGLVNTGGVFTAVASGNGDIFGNPLDACNQSPASTPEATTVNASQINDSRASFSNYGVCTDIFAPGVNITSAWNTSNTATNTISGTSMATPHVTGAGALYRSANPSQTPAQVDAALKANAALNKITNPLAGTPNRLLNIQFIGSGGGNVAPVANFTITCTTTTTPSKCVLDAAPSTDDAGFGNLTFAWANNVGRPAKTGQLATYNYATNNTFNVTLTATDAGGLSHQVTKQVIIPASGGGNQAPVANFTITCQTATVPHSCTADAAPSTDDGGFSNLTFAWANNVGRPAKTGQLAKYNFGVNNTFNVTLTATDAQGLTNSKTMVMTIP
jgi:subtilisin family serine protease